jgi:hypothetical protein
MNKSYSYIAEFEAESGKTRSQTGKYGLECSGPCSQVENLDLS